jgi:hypothetical protein
MTDFDPELQALIDTNERLIAEADRDSIESVAVGAGLDVETVNRILSLVQGNEKAREVSRAESQAQIEADANELKHAIDAEIARRGLRRPNSGGGTRRSVRNMV